MMNLLHGGCRQLLRCKVPLRGQRAGNQDGAFEDGLWYLVSLESQWDANKKLRTDDVVHRKEVSGHIVCAAGSSDSGPLVAVAIERCAAPQSLLLRMLAAINSAISSSRHTMSSTSHEFANWLGD